LHPRSLVHKFDNREAPIQLMIVAYVQAQHVTFHDLKSDIRKNPA